MELRSFRSAADETSDLFDSQRGHLGDALQSGESCARLWRAVIQKAFDDLAFLRRTEGGRGATGHQRQKIRRIQENPPVEFFESSWFMEICHHLDVDPAFVRESCDLERLSAA